MHFILVVIFDLNLSFVKFYSYESISVMHGLLVLS